MAKTINQTLSTPLKVFYSNKVFTQNPNILLSSIFSLLLLGIVSVLSSFKESILYREAISTFFIVLIALPIILFIFFLPYHIFINSFKETKRSILRSYLVFLCLSLPFIVVGHILTLLYTLTFVVELQALFNMLRIVVSFYFLVMLTLNLKTFYQTNYYQVFSSILLSVILFVGLLLVYFLRILINSF